MTTISPTFHPVLQTRHGIPAGNCFSACVASVLGLPLEVVPDYQCNYSDPDWWTKWEAWFMAHNLRANCTWDTPSGYAIVEINTPSPHSVVALDGRVVWNPEGNVVLPAGSVTGAYLALNPISNDRPN